MAVATLKIGDLLDLSSPLAASMPPGNVLTQLAGTVHHRPSHCGPPSDARPHRERKATNQMPRKRIKVERDAEEEKCPNVVVRNGVICTPYRDELEGCGSGEADRCKVETWEAAQTSTQQKVSLPFHSPLDSTAFSQNHTTQQLLRRLYLTRKLLALKKLTLKNQAMAVNLETLLPQAFQEASSAFPLVPCNGTDTGPLYSDISPDSMYGTFLDADTMPFDPSLFKEQLPFEDDGTWDGGEPLYQPGLFDNWMTTSMTLPLTPDEPLSGNNPTASPVPAHTHIYTSHTPSPVHPMTPESIVSPQSSFDGEELEEVLNFFTHTPADNRTPSTLYNDNSCSSSSYASVFSGPSSPSSPFPSSASNSPSSFTSYTSTPVTTPLATPTSLTHHSIAPKDTIRDLLARNSTHSLFQHDDVTSDAPTSGEVSSIKRTLETAPSSSAEPATKKVKAAPRSRKRVKPSVKKERKREQNKTAALRYRQKKKEEKVEFDTQQSQLEERNETLKDTLRGLEAEVNYLKHFWAEVQHAKKCLR